MIEVRKRTIRCPECGADLELQETEHHEEMDTVQAYRGGLPFPNSTSRSSVFRGSCARPGCHAALELRSEVKRYLVKMEVPGHREQLRGPEPEGRDLEPGSGPK